MDFFESKFQYFLANHVRKINSKQPIQTKLTNYDQDAFKTDALNTEANA